MTEAAITGVELAEDHIPNGVAPPSLGISPRHFLRTVPALVLHILGEDSGTSRIVRVGRVAITTAPSLRTPRLGGP